MGRRGGERSTARFQRKREAILDGATAILNHQGVKGLTLAKAAAAVDLSTTSVTYYFPRKDDLAAACLMRGIEWMTAAAVEAMEAADPAARLRRLFELHLERVQRTAVGAAAEFPAFSDLRALNDPLRTEVFNAYMGMFRQVRRLFEAEALDWLSLGRRTARTHMLLEQLFWAAAWLPRYDPDDYPRLCDRMVDILVHGLAAPGVAWSPLSLGDLAAPEGADAARETFLLAATRLINRRGYRGASVDLISAELKVTKGSFYHHHDAKDDLVVACFARNFDVMRRVQRLALAIEADHWTRLVSAAAALAEYQLSDQGPLLRTSALSALPEPIRVDMVRQSNRVSDRFAAMISDAVAEGTVRPVDPAIAAQMLAATLNAGAELAFWVPGVTPKAAPAVFVRPLMTGVFSR